MHALSFSNNKSEKKHSMQLERVKSTTSTGKIAGDKIRSMCMYYLGYTAYYLCCCYVITPSRLSKPSGALASEPRVSGLVAYPSTVHWMTSGLIPTGWIERGSMTASRDSKEDDLLLFGVLLTSPDISAVPPERIKESERERESRKERKCARVRHQSS